MKRSELKRSAALSRKGKGGPCPPRPKRATRERERWLGEADWPSRNHPPGWKQPVFEMHGAVCLASGEPAVDAHHCIYFQTLKVELSGRVDGRVMRAILADPRNGAPLARTPHFEHHHGTKRLEREVLPASVFVFASELDTRFGTRLLAWIDRTYPARGEPVMGRENRGETEGK